MEGKYKIDTYMYTNKFFALYFRNYDLFFNYKDLVLVKKLIFKYHP